MFSDKYKKETWKMEKIKKKYKGKNFKKKKKKRQIS